MNEQEQRIPETDDGPPDDAYPEAPAEGGDDAAYAGPEDGFEPVYAAPETDASLTAETVDFGDDSEADDAPAYAGEAYDDSTYADLTADAAPAYDFVDIDAALASVASLGELAAAREQAERAEQEAIHEAEMAREEAAARRPRGWSGPPLVALRRGQLASVVPALVLMATGAWLTFAVTAPGSVPAGPALIAIVLLGAVVVVLLAYWLASRRWSRGVLFFALAALLTAGAVYYETTLNAPVAITGSLVLAAIGLAFALTGLLSRPTDRRLLLPGILFLAAAGVNLAVIIGYIPAALLSAVAPFWPALAAVIVVLWLLPVAIKRRG